MYCIIDRHKLLSKHETSKSQGRSGTCSPVSGVKTLKKHSYVCGSASTWYFNLCFLCRTTHWQRLVWRVVRSCERCRSDGLSAEPTLFLALTASICKEEGNAASNLWLCSNSRSFVCTTSVFIACLCSYSSSCSLMIFTLALVLASTAFSFVPVEGRALSFAWDTPADPPLLLCRTLTSLQSSCLLLYTHVITTASSVN